MTRTWILILLGWLVLKKGVLCGENGKDKVGAFLSQKWAT